MSVLAVIDTETGALDVETGALIEMAYALVDIDSGVLISCASRLVDDPARKYGAFDVHGIPEGFPAKYEAAGVSSSNESMNRALKTATCITGWNCDFDRQWLPGVEGLWFDAQDMPWPKPSHGKSLIAVALAHGVGVTAAHRAIHDVLLLANLLARCIELGSDMKQMIAHASRPKKLVSADVPMWRNDELKAAGFRWHPKQPAIGVTPGLKIWWKNMFIDDIPGLGFDVREVTL